MMYLLDTDTLTHLHANHPNVINRLENLDSGIHTPFNQQNRHNEIVTIKLIQR